MCVCGAVFPKYGKLSVLHQSTVEQVLLLPNLGQLLMGQLVTLAALAVCKLSGRTEARGQSQLVVR